MAAAGALTHAHAVGRCAPMQCSANAASSFRTWFTLVALHLLVAAPSALLFLQAGAARNEVACQGDLATHKFSTASLRVHDDVWLLPGREIIREMLVCDIDFVAAGIVALQRVQDGYES